MPHASLAASLSTPQKRTSAVRAALCEAVMGSEMVAIFKGIGFGGVHIGGFGLKCDDVRHVMERSKEIGENWREHIPSLRHSQPGEYYLFPDDPELTFDEDKMRPKTYGHKKKTSIHFACPDCNGPIMYSRGPVARPPN